MLGKTVAVHGRRLEVVGILPPGTDLMDNRVAIWLPLGLNPTVRGFRGWHVLSLVGRLRDGVTPRAAQAEIDQLMDTWDQRVGVPTRGVFHRRGHSRASW